MIKSIVKFNLNKPVLNHIFLIFLVVLSIFSYRHIPKEIFPISTLDAVSIRGYYTGASSDILDKTIVSKIEDDLSSISEIDTVSSVVKNGSFVIVSELKKGHKGSEVIDDIKDVVTSNRVNFPEDMDEPTTKIIKHSVPLASIAIAGDLPKYKLINIANDLKSDLSRLGDLSDITVRGDSDFEFDISLNEAKIEAYGLSTTSVVNAIRNISSILPIGIIEDQVGHIYLSSYSGAKNISDYENMLLKIDGKAIYLKDIAKVEYKLGDAKTLSTYNGKPNVSIGINKGDSGDAISLVKEIKVILAQYHETYPNLLFDTYIDTSIWIKNRLNTVVANIIFGLMLLFTALFVTINHRIAFVVAIGVPVSFMVGLIGADYMGYSINMLSLLGGLLALGMLVDEAIVVAENIYRHMENGDDKVTATINGVYEVYPAILTATATTIFAFLPILIMTGQTGKFMKVLPIMITILLLSSLIEAFVFLPLHAKELFKVKQKKLNQHNEESDIWDILKIKYARQLNRFLTRKKLSLFGIVGSILFLTVVSMSMTKFQFMPSFDANQIYINGSVGVGHTLEQTQEKVAKIEKILLANVDWKQVSSVTATVGYKLNGKNKAQMSPLNFQIFVNLFESEPKNFFDKFINPILSPAYDDSNMIRTMHSSQINEVLNKALEPIQGEFTELKVFTQKTGLVKNDIEMSLSGDHTQVARYKELLKTKLNQIDGVSNIADDILSGDKELKFKVNEYGKELGFSEGYVSNILKPLYFQATFAKALRQSDLIDIKIQSIHKDDLSSLSNLLVPIPSATFSTKKVLLSQVVDFIYEPLQSQINKEDGKRIVTVVASLNKSKVLSEEVYERLDSDIKEIRENISLEIKGEQQENTKVKAEMTEAFIIAVILIFISLVWMFDSIVKPLIIISTIPLSILGVLLGHFIMGINLTMPGIIGIVGLAGVIVNDGIIVMDFIKNANTSEELVELAKLRLRPIILTSVTTVLGLSTLIFFASGQALILQPMAIALGFGILWATFLNLFYVPILYSVIYKK